ncbi:hypothetical protein RJ639_016393, partial [Escallonia herrerae]
TCNSPPAFGHLKFTSQHHTLRLSDQTATAAAMTEFLDLETQDAIRMPWNVLPGTKSDAAQSAVPISAVYTPLKPLPSLPVVPYPPLRCRTCRSVLSPFAVVDFSTKVWICPFCLHRNHFPPHYHSISDQHLPAELHQAYTTIEYESPSEKSAVPPVFIFVLDTSVIEEELGFLKSAVSRAVGLLPENSLVGLITFGTYVCVHELGFGHIPRVYVFKGSKEVSKDQVLEQMGFLNRRPKPSVGVIAGVRDGLSQESISRFLLPASECEFALNLVLEVLQKDPWPVPPDQRASRCTGTAISVAAHLLGVCVPGSGARIMAFVGGPSTEGPGSFSSKQEMVDSESKSWEAVLWKMLPVGAPLPDEEQLNYFIAVDYEGPPADPVDLDSISILTSSILSVSDSSPPPLFLLSPNLRRGSVESQTVYRPHVLGSIAIIIFFNARLYWQIVSKNLSEPIRSHKDLDKDSAPYYHKAVKFYEGLSKQLIHQGHVLDIFACALDQHICFIVILQKLQRGFVGKYDFVRNGVVVASELGWCLEINFSRYFPTLFSLQKFRGVKVIEVGVAELKVAVERSGGLVVLAESFGHSVFKDSLKRIFQSGDNDLGLSSNGIFEVTCSKDIKIQGIIGPCASLEKKGPLCSETVIGQGNTTAWKMCGLDKSTSLCLIFEVTRKDTPDAIGAVVANLFSFGDHGLSWELEEFQCLLELSCDNIFGSGPSEVLVPFSEFKK